MTVQELIRALEKCEQDAKVHICQYEGATPGPSPASDVSQRDTLGGGYTVTLY
jgi:hypothetical protein